MLYIFTLDYKNNRLDCIYILYISIKLFCLIITEEKKQEDKSYHQINNKT